MALLAPVVRRRWVVHLVALLVADLPSSPVVESTTLGAAFLAGTVDGTWRDLTEATLMDKVAVNRACKILENRGLVARAPNKDDGRSHFLQLTGEGRAIHEEVMPLALATERDLFADFDAAEQQQFRSLLKRIRGRAANLAEKTND